MCVLFLASCGAGGSDAAFTIKGKIDNGGGNTVYLEKFVNNAPVKIDSTTIAADGSFEIGTDNPALDFYLLTLSKDDGCLLILDSTDQNVYVEAEAGNMNKTYGVTGSKHTGIFVDFFRTSDDFEAAREEMRIEYEAVSASGDTARIEEVQTRVIQAGNEYYEYLVKTINDNPGSPACLSILQKLNIQNDIALYKKVEKNLREAMPESPYIISLATQISQFEQKQQQMAAQAAEAERQANLLKIGTEAPEINLNTPTGEPLPLSSLRGKVVLIDFWASWCRPCRAENPNVVRTYNKYKSKGFDVYSVSLDKNQGAWEQAIMQDGLAWNHVSDLAFWNSAAAKTYGVTSIPFTVLIDKEGKVIATKLRGQALEAKLEEIFGF